MLEKILLWATYFLGFLGLLALPSDIQQWHAAIKIYHRPPWRLIRRMVEIDLRTNKSYIFIVLFLTIFSITIGEAKQMVTGTVYPRVQGIIAILVIVQFALRYLVPPSVILLAPSRSSSVAPLVNLTRKVKPHRLITLIEHQEHVFFMDWEEIFPGNLRLNHGMGWRSTVHYLTDVVSVTIVDARFENPSVLEETQRQIKRKITGRTVFLTNADGSSPILEACRNQTDIQQLRLADEDSAAELTKDLLSALCKNDANWWTDSFNFQRSYDLMGKAVPRRFRQPRSIYEMLVKAYCLMDYAYKIFLREYKGCTLEKVKGKLVEDIPSLSTPEKELQWLTDSRELDEVENIFMSVLEWAQGLSDVRAPGESENDFRSRLEQVKGLSNGKELEEIIFMSVLKRAQKPPNKEQTFQIASTTTKLGKLARFRREWERAKEYLTRATTLFESLQQSDPSDRPVAAELADAHFLLGEVFMAQYRQTGAPSDRESSQRNFIASIALDQKLGQDYAETSKHIDAL